MSDGARPDPELVASFFTLSGGGFVDPPRNTFIQRCEAAAAAGFAGIGLHWEDLPRTVAAGVDVAEMRAVLRNNGLRLVEIEFLAGWALSGQLSPALLGIEAVCDALGGRQVSAGEFGGEIALDAEDALDRAADALRANANRLAERGLLVAVESFPWSALRSIRIAKDLLRKADAPNAGLLIDVAFLQRRRLFCRPQRPDRCRDNRVPTQRRPAGAGRLPIPRPFATPTPR